MRQIDHSRRVLSDAFMLVFSTASLSRIQLYLYGFTLHHHRQIPVPLAATYCLLRATFSLSRLAQIVVQCQCRVEVRDEVVSHCWDSCVVFSLKSLFGVFKIPLKWEREFGTADPRDSRLKFTSTDVSSNYF